MEIWMQQQASAVLIALRHAQELYGDPVPLRPFKPRPDSESHLGDGVLWERHDAARPVTISDHRWKLSGRAADAIADMHDELRRRYSGLNTAEAQLAEVLLTAQAANDTGRARLQDVQRQLIEAIKNPVNALDTPAGERQFLLFLRGKVAEIQRVVDDGELTAHDQADLAEALGSAYLTDPILEGPRPTPATSSQPAPAAPAGGMNSSPALGGLPQAAMPSAAPSSGLGTAASPLAGLASLLAGQPREDSGATPLHELPEKPEHDGVATPDEDARESHDDDDDDDDEASDAVPENAPTEDPAPAETRPAAS